jgi:chaperonin GroEL
MKRSRKQSKGRWQAARVVLQPEVYQGMQAGINQIVDAIIPTLGPRPRIVALESTAARHRSPEMLDDGGTIARRIIELPGRDEDVGAMYIRHVLWKLHERVGDGTATAAVMFKEVYNQGVRYLTSGGNAMRLRRYLDEGLRIIFDELSGMTTHLEGKEALARLAESICYDPPMAKLIGEIFDIIGEYGRLEIRSNRSFGLEREYIEGAYWDNGIVSRLMFTNQTELRAELTDALILITDLTVEDPRDLIPALTLVAKAKVREVFLIVKTLSDLSIGFLTSPKFSEQLKVVAAKLPGSTRDVQQGAMQDLAVLTGGRPIRTDAGDTLSRVAIEDFGRARAVWADRTHFGIIGGQGDPRELREHIAVLRAAHAREDEANERQKLESRLGKLISGSAILKVGAFTETELKARKELAERTASAMRAAMREGVLPGGGVALLACRPVLQQRLEQSQDIDERMAYRILLRAVEAPFRTLVENAGFEPSVALKDIEMAGPGHGFDVASGQVVDMAAEGIFDPAVVQKAAVRSAIGGAALALTTDVIVHRAAAPTEYQT